MRIQRRIIFFILFLFTLLTSVLCQQNHQMIPFNNLQSNQLKFTNSKNVHHLRTHDGYSYSSNGSSGSWILQFIIGPILFISSFAMIWFNEKRAVIDHRRLKLAQEICQDVNPFRRDQIQAAHMKLTHVSGNSTTKQIIYDKISGISAQNALKINVNVQVMQWRATVSNNNNHRSVSYNLGWQSQNQIKAQERNNPESNWFIKKQTIHNTKTFVGQYNISNLQIDQCYKTNPINPDINNAHQIMNNTGRRIQPQINAEYIYFPPLGSNNINDHGALRVKYSYCPTGPLSLMAKTVQNTFQSFPIAQYEGNGIIEKNQLPACCCLSNCVAQLLKPIQQIHLVQQQLSTKQQMIEHSIKKARIFTIIIRVVALFMMILGLYSFFSPIVNILGYFPLIGGLLKGAVGLIIFLGVIIICIPLYIITFSLAWLFYHPKVGIFILGVGITIMVVLIIVSQSKISAANATNSYSSSAHHFIWSHVQ